MSLPGISREEEEQFLADTIEIAQENLEHIREEVNALSEETENFMLEANKTRDKGILTLWNNVRAQLRENQGWLVRAEKARKKPYFGRIDFRDLTEVKKESYYIGRVGISKSPTEPVVIDWRAPVASLYYDNGLGPGTYVVDSEKTYDVDLKRKRTYEIEDDKLKDFYDMDVVSNDELLTKYLSKNKTQVLGEIIATIQKEQNQIIRRSPRTNLIVQGVAGSGKTTVAMHRISYILFNYAEEFRPEDFYIIGSNQILLNYITGVLPELDVYGAKQMTMEQLFIRLLYEDWDDKKYSYHPLDKNDGMGYKKGTGSWFESLQIFCNEYEKREISAEDIYLEECNKLLLPKERIQDYIHENPAVSMQSKRLMLNEILFAQYENVMSGRYSTFTEEERKELEKKYHTYFSKWGKYGKADWDGSVFELYQEFLRCQIEKGIKVDIPKDSFDVYDLAALAYLYKRIKEIDPIREASHVVIDEAQDFGMMAYQVLYYCLTGCTYTIMGDTSQNIHDQYGLNDWNELRNLILNGKKDGFFLLRKSYRNTVEISDFATQILRHGDFPVYPIEPIIRHGNPVELVSCSAQTMTRQAVRTIGKWQEQGYETIAVICRDENEVKSVSGRLKKQIEIKDMRAEDAEFGNGVMVLPVSYTKGLEFDAVLIWNPTTKSYPEDNGNVKILYVAATRALHELTVLHTKELTSLIGEKVSESRHQEEFHTEVREAEAAVPKVSARERLLQQKEDAEREMKERSYLGPARMQAIPVKKTEEPVGLVVSKPSVHSIKNKNEKSLVQKKEQTDLGINPSPFRYGEIPKEKVLTVKGHARPNLSVKWVKKTKTSLEVTSQYGILKITPITEACIRISFSKTAGTKEKSVFPEKEPQSSLKWTAKESPSVIEVETKQVIIRIEKRDGVLKFMTPDRKLLLAETTNGCRYLDDGKTWNFFEFDRSERLKSKGPLKDVFSDVTNKARYISHGGRKLRMPMLLSNKGYALEINAPETVLFCGIKNFGQFIYTEGKEQIDYYFIKD